MTETETKEEDNTTVQVPLDDSPKGRVATVRTHVPEQIVNILRKDKDVFV